MSRLLSRLPKFREAILVFWVAVFPIHFWSLIVYFHELPAFLLRMTLGEMIGVLAYTQVFALLESLLVTGIVILLALILPRSWLLERFVVNASIFVLISALWMAPVHTFPMIMITLEKINISKEVFWILWAGLYLLAIWDLIMVARRHVKFSRGLQTFADRISVLSGIFLVVDVLGLFIITYRLLA